MILPPKFEMAVKRFLSRYPILGGILEAWSIRAGGTTTMAIGFDGTELVLNVSPEFIESISLEEAVGVLHHEVRHVVYGHVFMSPEEYPDEHARVIAQEVTVNENLPETLPGDPILLSDYPKLPANESTQKRYKLLAKACPQLPSPRQTGSDLPDPGDSGIDGSAEEDSASPIGQSETDSPWDDHSRWCEIQADENAAREALHASASKAIQDARECGAKIDDSLAEQLEKVCGNAPGIGKTLLEDVTGNGNVAWQTVLRRYLGRELERDCVTNWPSRRFPELVGILPGQRSVAARANILAAIDTSGSMSDEDLAEIARELNRLRRTHEVKVVEFDCAIHAVYRMTGKLKAVQGRGGTDFHPVLDHVFLKQHRPDLVLIFTDGCGPAPEKPPRVPLIWILTADGEAPSDWGRRVWMDGSHPE